MRTLGQKFLMFPIQIFGRLIQVPQEALEYLDPPGFRLLGLTEFQSFSVLLTESFSEDLRFSPTPEPLHFMDRYDDIDIVMGDGSIYQSY
jgi:hypothetical protein